MSLLALRVALQGLFPLTPIAAAVQGLIEQIQEERRDPIGGGRQQARPARLFDDATDEDIERLVREKWEEIEAAQAAERPPVQEAAVSHARPARPVERSPQIEREVVLAMPAVVQAPAPLLPDAAGRAREARRRNDEEALMLMLAEWL